MMLSALVSSSLVQPAFGLWSDRRGATWLLPAGVAVSAAGVGAAAVAPAYGLVLLAVFLAGLGVAAYHPEGAKFAAFASGRHRASGMSYFNIGGNSGYALGPIVVTPLVVWLGSPQCDVTGRVFEIVGGRVNVCDGWQHGHVVDIGRRYDVSEVGAAVHESIAKTLSPAPVYGA
jgi:FSR family fosmidomycin resistance protein-like MFS transporter